MIEDETPEKSYQSNADSEEQENNDNSFEDEGDDEVKNWIAEKTK